MPPIVSGLGPPPGILPEQRAFPHGPRKQTGIADVTAATVTAQATADARGAQAGPPRRDGTPQATSPRLVREPEPGPDTPAGPPPAFEISILERERAVQALLARGTGNADPDAPAAPDGPTSAPSRPPARHLAADASIG